MPFPDHNILSAIGRVEDDVKRTSDITQNEERRNFDFLNQTLYRDTNKIIDNTNRNFDIQNLEVNRNFDVLGKETTRNFDYIGADNRRNFDNVVSNNNRNSEFILNDAKKNVDNVVSNNNRNSEFILNDAKKNVDNVILNGNRNSDFLLNDSRRNNEYTLNDTHRNFDNIAGAVQSTSVLGLNNVNKAATELNSLIQKTNTDNLLATHTTGSEIMNSIDNGFNNTQQVVERTANALGVSLERVNNSLFTSVQTNGDNTRNLLQNLAREERGYNFQHHSATLNAFKDSDLRMADYQRLNNDNSNRTSLELLKMKSELEKQASDNANASARDILTTRADILRQNLENTMAIQTEALKNKDSLSSKMMECCCEIKQKIDVVESNRLRDGLVEQRVENVILRHRSPERHHHRYDDYDGGDRRRGRGGYDNYNYNINYEPRRDFPPPRDEPPRGRD
jgi:cell division septum initiation protein DivIVA